MKKLIIIQTVAPDYRNLFFERLKDVLKDRFELYAGNESFERSIKTQSKIHKKLKNHFLFNRKLLFQTKIWHLLFKDDVIVLELNPRILSNWIFLIIRKITSKPTVLWGHAWPRNGKNSKSDILRHFMRKLGDEIIVYTHRQKKELQEKMPDKNIVAAPNALLKSESMVTEPNASAKNLVYVGRLVAAKKVYFLVKAFHHALDLIPEYAKLIIVGDGEEKENLQQYINQHNLTNRIQLLGHISDYKTLKKLYYQSLFSVSPGYGGLSITQSFGFGVPMLISKNENHSPEIEAVRQGENSLFFKTGDMDDFAQKLQSIYRSKEEWLKKREKIVDFCKKNYSVEAMAQVFVNLVNN